MLPVSEVKMKLSALLEELRLGNEEVWITRNGRAAGVLVSPRRFESWMETLTVLGDEELMREIRDGLATLEKGTEIISPDDLLDE